jgi:hypothetical protein
MSTVGSGFVHGALSTFGLIPVAGEFFDGADAALYSAEGDYKNAAWSSAAMVTLLDGE